MYEDAPTSVYYLPTSDSSRMQRHQLVSRAMGGGAAFLLVLAFFQYFVFTANVQPGVVDQETVWISVSINLALAALALTFFAVNTLARRFLDHWWEVFIGSMHVTTAITMLAWVAHIHIAGSQGTPLLVLIPGSTVVSMWLLGRGWAWFYFFFANLALAVVQGAEVMGYLEYFPLAGTGAAEHLEFLDVRYRIGNGFFYLLASIGPLVLVSQLFADLTRSQKAVVRANKRLEVLASTDSLTGLLIRRAVMPKFEEEIIRSDREKRPLSVIILDIDNFKSVNDTYGHAVGDQVIKEVADVLLHCFRTYDLVARIGGEEFMVVLPGNDLHAGYELAERARMQLRERVIDSEGHELSVTASFGVAEHAPGRRETVDQLILYADDAHYHAKRAGKDRVCMASAPEETTGMALA
ncbi:MAG: GGDEF domain-containing protein [Deltaproteobacteria bacterium]|nr:GGDEF domain-containing protein [bacterium]MCB9477510.1 GGDEF domain-containing protein [Deltaproteobacteria bacterium]MCB9488072.1 GGDEF domain-containing protein [Deltaproteobacteria bacterium]